MRIKKHIAVLRWAAILLSALWYLPSQAQTTDSLSHYLETAARYNPSVNSSFALYKASLEKIPQAGAFSDPELEMGFFFKPMEQLSGKQVADFTLMQMFPWFGTRKAARNEATEMARMAYEQFRETRNNLFYEVKSQWYQLNNLNEQYKNTAANLELLKQLELLALSRYTASSVLGRPTPVRLRSHLPFPRHRQTTVWAVWKTWGPLLPRPLRHRAEIQRCRVRAVRWQVVRWGAVHPAACPTYFASRSKWSNWKTTSKLSDRTGKQPKPGSTAC